jgi:carbonic anhydrase
VSRHGLPALAVIVSIVGFLQLITGSLKNPHKKQSFLIAHYFFLVLVLFLFLVLLLLLSSRFFFLGILRAGTIVRLIPIPVISGFTFGIGALILLGQLPRALGVVPQDASSLVSVLSSLQFAQWPSATLAAITIFCSLVLPRFFPRLPGPLVGLAISTALAYALQLPVDILGPVPTALPMPHLPPIVEQLQSQFASLLRTSLVIWGVASLESLLSCSALDSLVARRRRETGSTSKSTAIVPRHDPDQELIGQGIGNILTSLFAGMRSFSMAKGITLSL